MMKHYTVAVYDKPPKGALRRYIGIDAENKTDLKTKIAAFNKENKMEYIPLRSAFTLTN